MVLVHITVATVPRAGRRSLVLTSRNSKKGKDLIRLFLFPAILQSEQRQDRNLPEHAPDKWGLFKFYNQRDVEVEMQIHKRLQNYPVPDIVWNEYHISEINDRGI